MPSAGALHKAKLTVTISSEVVNEIDKISKGKRAPRSQVMEEALRYWLLQTRKKAIEQEVAAYYLSLTEEEKKEDRTWAKTSSENAKGAWRD